MLTDMNFVCSSRTAQFLPSMESWAANKKVFKLVCRCHQLLSGFLTTCPECHVSHVCQLTIRVIPRAVHISPRMYFKAEKNPEKPQLGDRRLSLCDQASPQMGPRTSKPNSPLEFAHFQKQLHLMFTEDCRCIHFIC